VNTIWWMYACGASLMMPSNLQMHSVSAANPTRTRVTASCVSST
jgi:hypothetical protein